MKKKMLKILPIILVLVIVSPFLVKQYEDYLYKKSFKDNKKNEPYSRGVPLEEMDFSDYQDYFAFAPIGNNDPLKVVLPCDIHYYRSKNDAEPTLTLEKGTSVYVLNENGETIMGYGLVCWPDYDSEWRYGHQFFTFAFSDVSSEMPMYYVKSKQLKSVAKAYYKVIASKLIRSRITPSEYASNMTRMIDASLYFNGVFCAPHR